MKDSVSYLIGTLTTMLAIVVMLFVGNFLVGVNQLADYSQTATQVIRRNGGVTLPAKQKLDQISKLHYQGRFTVYPYDLKLDKNGKPVKDPKTGNYEYQQITGNSYTAHGHDKDGEEVTETTTGYDKKMVDYGDNIAFQIETGLPLMKSFMKTTNTYVTQSDVRPGSVKQSSVYDED